MKKIRSIVLIGILPLIFSCSPKTKYAELVEKELASGIRQDTVLLGLHFGMSKEQFYKHCWDLNQKGIIKEGYTDVTIYYPLGDLPHEGFLDFFPIFKEEKIQSFQGFTMYTGWAPWNKHLWSDQLIEDTREVLEGWYPGNKFFAIKSPGRGKAYVKVDGNRRIVLYYVEDSKVNVLISDLTNPDQVLSLKSD